MDTKLRHRIFALGPALGVAFLMAFLCGSAAASDLPLEKGDFARRVPIGHGRELYLECHGKARPGEPTVILEAGLRSRSDFWSKGLDGETSGSAVFPKVADFARVCAYDRPGTTFGTDDFSRSTPVPMPRTAADAVADLHKLLKDADVPGPYVLVGHSTGGLINRLYAATYPQQVVGMVLVDALSEFLEGPMSPSQTATFDELNNAPIPALAHYPDLEAILFRPSFAEMKAAERRQPLGEIPLSVISRGLPVELPPGLPDGLDERLLEHAWTVSQAKLAGLTPDAVHVIAHHSSHYVMFTQPELIVDQVERVLRLVGAGQRE